MSASALKRLSLGNGWVPEPWHLKLADQLAQRMSASGAAMAVYGVFGTAVLRDSFTFLGEFPHAKCVVLQDAHKRACAKDFLPDLARALGFPVILSDKPLFKSGTSGARAFADPEFRKECQRRVERLKSKVSNRGVEL